MIGRAIGAALVAAWAVLGAGVADAQRTPKYVCNFQDESEPCRVSTGVYRALVPEGAGPHPAIVYLYGSLGKSRAITDARYFQQQVVGRGYALIVPAALDVTYRGNIRGTGWGRRARARSHPRDDLAFIREVIGDAVSRHNVDPRRILFMGQSDGGFLIFEIACHNPEMGAAFAVHAASYGGALPRGCKRPVRFLQTHGRRDDVVPFRGEMRVGPFLQASDVGESLALLAETNGCVRPDPVPERKFGFTHHVWEGCVGTSSLEQFVHAGGHGPPPTWIPAVIDWFERTGVKPPTSVTRRVGVRKGFKSSSSGGGSFKRVPD